MAKISDDYATFYGDTKFGNSGHKALPQCEEYT